MRKTRNYYIDIYCSGCDAHLYRYLKEGGEHLVKCYFSNIVKNYTQRPRHCQTCGQEFARAAMYHNRPAFKIIQGKVYVRR